MTEIIKVSVYVLIDLIPGMMLAIIPFQSHMRHNKYVLVVSSLVMYVTLVACRVLAIGSLSFAAYFTGILIAVYLIFYRLNFSVKFTTLLFVLLVILNYGSFAGIIHTYLSERFIAGYAGNQYAMAANGILAAVIAVSYPFMLYMMAKKIKPLISADVNNKVWTYLWMVPATSCLSYYYSLFVNGGILEFIRTPHNVVFAVVLNMGSLFVTYIVIYLVKDSNDSLLLKTENYKLNMQNLQYDNLKNKIEETRRARHDLRQFVMLAQSCIRDKDMERLEGYMDQYTDTLPPDSTISYCQNYAVNALVLYYADLCHKQKILFQIHAQYPADCRIQEADAIILLGNLLENALEACLRMDNKAGDTKPFMVLNIQCNDNNAVITLDNTYNGTIIKMGKGFQSSKNEHSGIGISTIQNIAEKYHGITKFEYDDEQFHSSVLLNISS